MVGKKNRVAAKLKNIVPTLLSVHCICHRLALACTDTNKDIEYISTIDRILTQLWKYFDDSPKRTAALRKTQLQMHQIAIHTQELVHISKIVISLPVSNAWSKRGDSAIKRIKTRLKTSPKNDMLATLLQVSVDGPEVKEADKMVHDAVGKWVTMKKRKKLSNTVSEEAEKTVTQKEVETEDAGIQTDLAIGINELEENQQRVMNLMKQAAKIVGLNIEDIEDGFEYDDDKEDEFDDEDLFE
ncbi:Hypothetical predicted protein [Mytilus galloprovincialis]|uniref:Uncharacterized protein n=1 Tax=Mytilus galloprovincialis TaxID=29158 RepID=A0A8B6FTB8_MYTGA|nr:Hypothetical predicted protein [Mytilus galloprovincialis]